MKNFSRKDIADLASKRRADFQKLYDVYSDWRSRGYVIKTGFKFGTHFRVYFPGAQPMKNDESWVHSRHVIHVFPRDAKLLISEWARVDKSGAFGKEDLHTCDTWQEQEEDASR